MTRQPEAPVTRRKLLAFLGGSVVVAAFAAPSAAEARPWGAPPGWSRGRKRGWAKKGGPKRRW
jgi:hypothetical protein